MPRNRAFHCRCNHAMYTYTYVLYSARHESLAITHIAQIFVLRNARIAIAASLVCPLVWCGHNITWTKAKQRTMQPFYCCDCSALTEHAAGVWQAFAKIQDHQRGWSALLPVYCKMQCRVALQSHARVHRLTRRCWLQWWTEIKDCCPFVRQEDELQVHSAESSFCNQNIFDSTASSGKKRASRADLFKIWPLRPSDRWLMRGSPQIRECRF